MCILCIAFAKSYQLLLFIRFRSLIDIDLFSALLFFGLVSLLILEQHCLLVGVCIALSAAASTDTIKRSNIESTKDKREAPLATASASEYGVPAITKRVSQQLYGGISTPPYSTYGPPQPIGTSQYDGLSRYNDLNAVHGLPNDGYNTFGNNLDVVADNAGYDGNYQSNLVPGPYRAPLGNGDFGNIYQSNRFGNSFGSVLGGVGSTSSFNGPPGPGNTYLPTASVNQNLPAYASGHKGLGHYTGSSSGLGNYAGASSNVYNSGFDSQRYNAPFTNSRPVALTSAALAAQTYAPKDTFRPSAFLGSTLLPSTPDYQYAQPSLQLTSLGVANQFDSPAKTYLPSNAYQSSILPSYVPSSSTFGSSPYTDQNANFGPTATYVPKSSIGYGLPFNSYRPNPAASFSHNQLNPTYATSYEK